MAEKNINASIKQVEAEIKALEKLGKNLSNAQDKTLQNLRKQRSELKAYKKDYHDVSLEFQAQADIAVDLAKTMKGINKSEIFLKQTSRLIVKYGKDNNKNAQKLAKSLSLIVDASATIQQNMEAIGTSEFQSLNLSKLIFNLRKQNANIKDKEVDDQIKYLRSQQDLQDRLQKAHDITEETAKQFLKPVKYMQDLIGQIPIVGGLLSKMIPIEKWEDDLKNKIGEQVKKAFMIPDLAEETELPKETKQSWNDFQKSMGVSSKEAGKLWKQQKKGAKVQKDVADESAETAINLEKVNMSAIGFAALGAVIVGVLAKWVLASFQFANQTGLAYTQTLKLGGALAINAEGVAALTEEFGNINDITSMHAGQMLRLNKQYGISATASAKILKLQTATSGQTKSQLLTVQKEVAQMARLEGVSPAAVFESMSASSEDFAKFTKDSGKNLMKMAIQAKKVGVEMGSILQAMEGSLDLESSINAQFEASVLLGRQINLDKFRQLSLAGDALGAQKEIVRLVGSESEWNSMNLIQRKALAAAVGLQVSEVSKIVGAQNKVNEATEKGSSSLWKWVAIGAALGTVLLGIVGALVGSLNSIPILGQKMSASGWKGMKSGALKGGGTGLLLGGIGGGVASALMAKPPVSGATMNPGTVANVRRGEMSIHKGETAVRTQDFNMMPMIDELKALRKDMRVGSVERAEQSRQQINTIRGIGAANA
jgi:hypothetical protein